MELNGTGNSKIKLEMCASEAHIRPVPEMTKERRAERLVARVSEADKKLLQRAASLEGRSVATFVLAHAREVARRIVADYETIELDAIQSRRFVKACGIRLSGVNGRLAGGEGSGPEGRKAGAMGA